MAEVFISYARGDQGFVRDLDAALHRLKRETWVDWRSIPESAEWRAQILAAIDGADNFLFIVSPDSLRSEMCRAEVAHAAHQAKRIITLLYHAVTWRDLFPELQRIQWINYPELGFKHTFRKLKDAIDADLEWGRKQTQLGLRAAQWEDRRRDNGFLLHGTELQEALQWLKRAPKIDTRQPTDLQEGFIRASEAWDTGEVNRLTRLSEERDRQRKKAERAARVAVARERVASSVLSLEEDPERSILLAMHAAAATLRRDGAPLPEAEQALHRALELSLVRVAIRQPGTRFLSVDWSANGKLATGSDKNVAQIWDAGTGKLIMTLKGHRKAVDRVAFGPDGARLASASADKTAKVWDVASGRALVTLRHSSAVRSIAWSRDGERLATGSDKARWWDARSGKLVRSFDHKGVLAVAWSHDNQLLATGGHDAVARVWNVDSGALLRTWANDSGRVRSVCWSPDDGRLLVSGGMHLGVHPTNVARVWGFKGKRNHPLFSLPPQASDVTSAVWSPDGDQIATATFYGRATIWNADSQGKVVSLLGHDAEHVVWSPASDCVATAGPDGQVRVWHVDIDSELPLLRGHSDKITAAAWSPDSRRIATASWDHMARIWDAVSGVQLLAMTAPGVVLRAVAWSPDGKQLATVGWDAASVWSTQSGELIATLVGHSGNLSCVAWSPHGAWLATTGWDGAAVIWDATTFRMRRRLLGHANKVHGLDCSPDGRFLATGSLDGSVKVWDASTGKQASVLPRQRLRVGVLAWSPDGKKLAVGGLDGSTRICDIARRHQPVTLAGHRDMVTALAWSPDSRRLAVGGGDEMGGLGEPETTVRVWDVSAREVVLTFQDHADVVSAVAWSPDGKRLATAGVDRTVRQYAVDIELLLKVARSRVTRNLTPDECRKFLHVSKVPPIP